MGVSHSWAEVGAKFDRLASSVATLPVEGVKDSAQTFKTLVKGAAPARLRNVGKSGRNLGVTYTISGSGESAEARVRATGPWPLIEENVPEHAIRPKKKRAAGNRAAVVWPDASHPVMVVHHPGTKGKHIWRKTAAAFSRVYGKPFQLGLAKRLNSIF